MSKTHPWNTLTHLRQDAEPVLAARVRGQSLLRVTLVALLLVFGYAVADEDTVGEFEYSSAELEQQATEWESFNSKVEQELRLLFDQGFPDKGAFGLEPQESWRWWDDQHTMASKALRGRLVRWLRAIPFMEGASDPNLWFVVQLLEGAARVGAQVQELEAVSPRYSSFASSYGPGSEHERFALWTECAMLSPILLVNPKDDAFKDSIKAAVESRLRGARIYGDHTSSDTLSSEILRIVVTRGSDLYSISVGLQKVLFDPISQLKSHAYGDYRGGGYASFGSGSPEYVRSVLADHLDKFIADYLRVNEDACGGSPDVSK